MIASGVPSFRLERTSASASARIDVEVLPPAEEADAIAEAERGGLLADSASSGPRARDAKAPGASSSRQRLEERARILDRHEPSDEGEERRLGGEAETLAERGTAFRGGARRSKR